MSGKILCRGYQFPIKTSTLNFPHTGSIFSGESLKHVLDFLIFSLFNKSTENFPPLFKKIALLLLDRNKKHANSTDQQSFVPHMSKFFRKRICKINSLRTVPVNCSHSYRKLKLKVPVNKKLLIGICPCQ